MLLYLHFLRLTQGPLIRSRMSRPARFLFRAVIAAAVLFVLAPHNPPALAMCLELGVWVAYVMRHWGTQYDGPERRRSVMVQSAHWI